MEVTSSTLGVGHKTIWIRNNSNRALGIDIMNKHVPGVGFKVYDVYNDALKPHIKKGEVIKFVHGYNDNGELEEEEIHANRFELDCRELSFQEFQSSMRNVVSMELISICVNQSGYTWSSDRRYNDILYNDIYFL